MLMKIANGKSTSHLTETEAVGISRKLSGKPFRVLVDLGSTIEQCVS
jgi:hypothetical protein